MNIRPFRPAKGLRCAHLQTVYPAIFRRVPRFSVEIESFELEDGDFVDSYWYHKPTAKISQPIVTLFHGLEGSFESSYIRGVMSALHKEGYAVVVMHFRGCSGRPNRLPRSYHSGDTQDAKAWIEHLQERYRDAPLFAIGYSLGGNMLLKLLGEQGGDGLLSGAIAISAPMQLDISAKRMQRGFSKFYQYYLLRDLKMTLKGKFRDHNMRPLISIGRDDIGEIRDFCRFDDLYTAPIHGFDSAEDYYKRSSAKQFLKEISTPTLIIHSRDDPFMTDEVLPDKDEISSSVVLEVYEHGGHVGFVGGTMFRPKYWLEERVVDFLKEFTS